MRRKTRLSIRRKMSGTLACLLTAISVLSTSGAVPTMASESKVKMSYKQEDVQKIGIHVEAENESFGAGESVLLNVYIQNNSGEPLKDGTLKWVDKKETLTQGGFLFESENDMTEAEEATPDSAEEIEEAEETLVPETSAAAETMAAEAVVVEESAAEETAASEEPVAAETTAPEESAAEETAAPEETAAEETAAPEENAAETEIAGPSEETAAEAGPAGPSEDMAPTQAAGPSSDNGDDFGTAWEEDWFEDEDEDDAEIEGPYLDEEGNICNIDLAPGEIFTVQFAGTIDEDIYGLRNRDIRFTFGARKPNGKRLSNNVKFQFNTGLMTMLPVEFEDGNLVETNEENTMTLRLGLDDIEYMFEEMEKEKADEATPSEATPSETEKEFTAAEVVKPEDEATPSEASKATPSEAEETKVEIAAAEEEEEENEATPSEAKKEEDEEDEEDDENNSDGVFNPEDVKYTIETYGVRLKGVKARFDVDASGPAESVTEVSYRVASGTEPGLYFGKVTASVKFNGNTYKTTQGFHINVTGEGEMALRGKLGDAEIIVSGDPASFGAEDYEILSLQVTEVPVEKEDMITEAMEKKSEETGVAVEKMKAMDIKVVGDGEVRELQGPVTVTFAGLELEEVKQADAEPEEKSLVEQAVALMSLDGEEETAAETTASEQNTAVWHLDEDAVEMTDMESYINDDGDVVMETDHFSVFIVVNTTSNQITVRFQHATYLEQLKTSGGSVIEDTKTDTTQLLLERETKLTKIYSDDERQYGNGFKSEVQNLSKLHLANLSAARQSYELKEVWIRDGLDHDNYGFVKNSTEDLNERANWDCKNITDAATITLDKNSTIRFIYEPKVLPDYSQEVTFYDYNVTDGDDVETITGNSGYKKGINTLEANSGSGFSNAGGINRNANYGGGRQGNLVKGTNNYTTTNTYSNGGNRLAVGIAETPIMHTYGNVRINGKFVNRGNGGAATGIVGPLGTPLTDAGLPDFKVYEPGLFGNASRGKKVVSGYDLIFKQTGDTYTLSSVKDSDGKTVSSSLERMQAVQAPSGGATWTNNFWPLDSYSGKVDPLFGGETQYLAKFKGWYSNGVGLTNGYTTSPYSGYSFGKNDDFNNTNIQNRNGNNGHNWFFGMNYKFEFELDDSYTGPLTFYFRGDDDFWLYVDGKLRVDIGGLHSAIGATLNLRDAGVLDPNRETHSIEVFYTERGGTGSCCYMEFTIPKAVPVIPDTTTTHISKSVKKNWDDDNNGANVRPEYIDVVLLQDDVEYRQGRLEESNDWEYEWSYLPKYENGAASGDEYTYTVKEISAAGAQISSGKYDDNYTLTIENNKNGYDYYLTNTYHEKTSVKVTKQWVGDAEEPNARPGSITVNLKNGDMVAGTVSLPQSGSWEYTWNNLPKYNSSGEQIPYTVEEADDYWMKSESRPEGWYVASAPTGNKTDGFVIKNTFEPEKVTRTVKKIWDDQNDKYGLQPDTLNFQLKQGSGNYGSEITLPYNGQWEYTWRNLPKYYYTKSGGTVTQHEYAYTVEEKAFTNDDYYTPSHAVSGTTTTFTNSLRTAKFRVAKRIDNFVEAQNAIETKDLDQDEFIVTVDQQSGDFSTGVYLYHAGNADNALDESKLSAYIEVPVTDDGVTFAIDEIVPKEYKKANTFLTMVGGADGKAVLDNGTVKVYEGADDVVVIVHNEFTHDDYFHDEASVDNVFDKDEIPAEYKTAQVNLNALIPEKKDKEEMFM